MSKTFKREKGMYGEVGKGISRRIQERKEVKNLENDLRQMRNSGAGRVVFDNYKG